MGVLDDILGKETRNYRDAKPKAEPKPRTEGEVQMDTNAAAVAASPVSLTTSFLPIRLAAKKDNKLDLIIGVKNVSQKSLLISVDARMRKADPIGFDATCMNKVFDKKLGNVEPGAFIEFPITIYGSSQTKPNNYPIGVTVYVHFMEYTKVENQLRRIVTLRVI
jgi:hypothetical protein